ncbi:MAG: hypothetical protein JSS56_05775 [Proteobacteria bacterium]|nr:hypothetical protein [Pseudomonadota bacterium]
MTHHRTLPFAAPIAVSMLLAAIASNLRAQAPNGSDAAIDRDVGSLMAAYLGCERVVAERLLDTGEAADCSVIYEELLKVGFDGDFERLLTWWHAVRLGEPRGERIATP